MSQRVVKKDDHEEIEGVESPPKKSGQDSMARASFLAFVDSIAALLD